MFAGKDCLEVWEIIFIENMETFLHLYNTFTHSRGEALKCPSLRGFKISIKMLSTRQHHTHKLNEGGRFIYSLSAFPHFSCSLHHFAWHERNRNYFHNNSLCTLCADQPLNSGQIPRAHLPLDALLNCVTTCKKWVVMDPFSWNFKLLKCYKALVLY